MVAALVVLAVQQGVSRAAMLSFSLLLLVGSVSVLTSCTKDDDTIYVPDPTDAPSTKPLVRHLRTECETGKTKHFQCRLILINNLFEITQ